MTTWVIMHRVDRDDSNSEKKAQHTGLHEVETSRTLTRQARVKVTRGRKDHARGDTSAKRSVQRPAFVPPIET